MSSPLFPSSLPQILNDTDKKFLHHAFSVKEDGLNGVGGCRQSKFRVVAVLTFISQSVEHDSNGNSAKTKSKRKQRIGAKNPRYLAEDDFNSEDEEEKLSSDGNAGGAELVNASDNGQRNDDSADDTNADLHASSSSSSSASPLTKVSWLQIPVADSSTPCSSFSCVVGCNNEVCHIGASICAERSAIVQLRTMSLAAFGKLYIISDLTDGLLTPGLLCREMLMEILPRDIPVVLARKQQSHNTNSGKRRRTASSASSSSAAESSITSDEFEFQIFPLSSIYPFPCLYSSLSGADSAAYAKYLQSTFLSFPLSPFSKLHSHSTMLYDSVYRAAKSDKLSWLHPISYAGGVLYADGEMLVTKQTKGLEYGTTADPFVKLLDSMEERKLGSSVEKGVPVLGLFLDQYGILHAPTAIARANFLEGGFEKLEFVLHDAHGKLVKVSVKDLAPANPAFHAGWNHSNAGATATTNAIN